MSPALELPPTEQMEGARGERVLFLEGEESFQGERMISGPTFDTMPSDGETTIVFVCDQLCRQLLSWKEAAEDKVSIGGEINAAPSSLDISSCKIIVAVHSQRETHVFKVLRRWRQQCSCRHDYYYELSRGIMETDQKTATSPEAQQVSGRM